MTNEKLIALLREASACVVAVRDDDLRARIDAALHAYDTAPARPEWVVRSWSHYPSRASSYRMGLPNTNIEVRRARDNKWSFLVTRHGLKDTLEEAQAAALDAAKEMA
jgi:hypothetical protein